MADNRIKEVGRKLSLTCTHPASPSSGDPVRIGNLIGVALTDERTAGDTTVDLEGVYDLSVKGEDDDGNSAVAVGDKLYYVDADVDDGTGYLNKKVTGYFAGIALEVVTSGSTTTINVRVGSAIGLGDASLPRVSVTSQSVAFGDFTDVDTTGYVDLDTDMPAGAIPIGCKFVVSTGFTGDTTAIVQAGIAGTLDMFTENTDQSVLAAATVGSTPTPDCADGMNAAKTIRVTVTGGADFTSISAGVMVVYVYYLATV
ncbi:MAG: DUF2190 family protein [Ignavibacteriaceae bacterium]